MTASCKGGVSPVCPKAIALATSTPEKGLWKTISPPASSNCFVVFIPGELVGAGEPTNASPSICRSIGWPPWLARTTMICASICIGQVCLSGRTLCVAWLGPAEHLKRRKSALTCKVKESAHLADSFTERLR